MSYPYTNSVNSIQINNFFLDIKNNYRECINNGYKVKTTLIKTITKHFQEIPRFLLLNRRKKLKKYFVED